MKLLAADVQVRFGSAPELFTIQSVVTAFDVREARRHTLESR